jgi:hypothetical protein
MDVIKSDKNDLKLLRCWATKKCPEDTDCSEVFAFYVGLSVRRVHFLRCNEAFTQKKHTKLNRNNLTCVPRIGHWVIMG